jgi:hypothetical protein
VQLEIVAVAFDRIAEGEAARQIPMIKHRAKMLSHATSAES